ncbi:FdhF/YdeP family oxidoreductase [Roseomonas marmotae]|uniref:FdhF/YdeP family oxidoreductase n=1 Tax=Roseomonas marmotae TaxID=2768161 RepID=A0ABS3KGA9_9PROT|nr:FdhF/YdeP family oxidoreductase [Roseomonas marmotae]MBO1076511.1 FdhF/YdeP family oxidoreductase [Roseomonas marmotae]QTI81869.1 FdhF/YdeP family oxidoreductase [Roseomonas marmotae]
MSDGTRIEPYEGPAGGWGSLKSVEGILHREGRLVGGNAILMKQNKPDGFGCVSCAWEKPAVPHTFEYCENGAKATAWEITSKRTTADFFAAHSLAELRGWRDHDLEAHGRLTQPMRWDPETDKYRPVSWDDAFQEIGAELRRLEPDQAVFYVSGRASLEASYMWGLFARLHGTNNLPDSSNMCHESTSVALPESIGVAVGTVSLDDFHHSDCIFFFGQNPGSNSPRMLHPLQEASKRGVPIITFNPLHERGLERFLNPQAPLEMLTGSETRISTQYHQVKAGGDIAAIMGMCKALIEADDAKGGGVLDHDFIAQHTSGFEDFARAARDTEWAEIEQESGLTRKAMEAAARCYAQSKAVIGIYGMGLTQHRRGVENVQMLANLLLLRGNIGKPGAGICPVRGHSNVQGQRTIGITEKPELVPLDRLAEQYNFQPPRSTGLNTVEACQAIIDGSVRAFLALGGNFIRAVPETQAMEDAWPRLRLSVQIATKLNRSHLIPGEVTYLLPCLGRIEIDRQSTGAQGVSIEDSNGQIHPSRGIAEPAGPHLRSEPAIIAGLAKATLPMNARVPWDEWVADYSRIRDAAAETYPDIFVDFNARLRQPGGFPRPRAARERVWKTSTGKANFISPAGLRADPDVPLDREGVLQLITLRSNDQFNTTVYGYEDRFRGVSGTRDVVFVSRNDMVRLGLEEGQAVTLASAAGDGKERQVSGLRVVAYDLPDGCIAAYYPECNRLIPLWHHAERSKVPAAKSVPVHIQPEGRAA